jgi:hypothetical protein
LASNTPRLNLYKKDPVADANDTFNIQTMLNDNWDKIDAEVAKKSDFDAYLAETTQELNKLRNKNNEQDKEIANLNLQLEASQRVTNGKTFGTDFLNTFGMTIDYTKAMVQGATSSGATTVTVDDATGFQVGQEVTIYDDVNLERVVISSITGNDITFSTALVNAYKDKANIARSMAVEDTVNQCLKFGGWSTQTQYSVSDATVINQAYDTSGNGGRKLVRLSNGWLVDAVFDSANSQIKFFVSQDNGQTFQQLCYVSGIISTISFALASKGTNVYLLVTMSGPVMGFVKFDATTVTNTDLVSTKVNIDTGQSSLGGGASLAINSAGTELHAVWASKNSTYSNSFNIRYAKGTINGDGSVTWGAVEQRTSVNSSGYDYENPSIVLANGKPVVLASYRYSTSSYRIICRYFNGSSWSNDITVYEGNAYAQSSPSAIFVPSEINGLPNGRIWVAWHGADATDNSVNNIRVSYSDDGGVTWSAMTKLTSGNSNQQIYPSITCNVLGEVFVVWRGVVSSVYRIRQIKYNGAWGTITEVTNNTTSAEAQDPSTLYDISLNFSLPLFIYKNNGTTPKVGFYGTWAIGTETPILENDVRFTVQDTDEIALWVERDEVAGFTVDAEVNGNAMTKESVTGEDQFTYDLGTVQSTEVRLNLQRASTGDDVKITKILGGVA